MRPVFMFQKHFSDSMPKFRIATWLLFIYFNSYLIMDLSIEYLSKKLLLYLSIVLATLYFEYQGH